jgi:hypothetical protein
MTKAVDGQEPVGQSCQRIELCRARHLALFFSVGLMLRLRFEHSQSSRWLRQGGPAGLHSWLACRRRIAHMMQSLFVVHRAAVPALGIFVRFDIRTGRTRTEFFCRPPAEQSLLLHKHFADLDPVLVYGVFPQLVRMLAGADFHDCHQPA